MVTLNSDPRSQYNSSGSNRNIVNIITQQFIAGSRQPWTQLSVPLEFITKYQTDISAKHSTQNM